MLLLWVVVGVGVIGVDVVEVVFVMGLLLLFSGWVLILLVVIGCVVIVVGLMFGVIICSIWLILIRFGLFRLFYLMRLC